MAKLFGLSKAEIESPLLEYCGQPSILDKSHIMLLLSEGEQTKPFKGSGTIAIKNIQIKNDELSVPQALDLLKFFDYYLGNFEFAIIEMGKTMVHDCPISMSIGDFLSKILRIEFENLTVGSYHKNITYCQKTFNMLVEVYWDNRGLFKNLPIYKLTDYFDVLHSIKEFEA